MVTPSDIDWARLAAFIDGEGSIRSCIQRKKNKGTAARFPIFATTVQVANTDLVLMTWLSNRFGGVVEQKKNGGGRRRTLYIWRLLTKDQVAILEGCMPYFILKRRQAELAIELILMADQKRRPRTPEKALKQHATAVALNELNLTRGKHMQFGLPMVQ